MKGKIYHWQRAFATEKAANIVDNFARIVVWNFRTPTCPNAFSAVHKHHRQNRAVPVWLDALVVLHYVVQHGVVQFVEDRTGQWA